jgi:hypothetical protein
MPALSVQRPSGLKTVKQEPNLEKKAHLALEFAHDSVDSALNAYRNNDPQAGKNILVEMLEAVELAHTALRETGKSARRRPKHFKRSEIQTRRLLEQLDSLSRNLYFEERAPLEPIIKRVSDINDQLLKEIMERPKKK